MKVIMVETDGERWTHPKGNHVVKSHPKAYELYNISNNLMVSNAPRRSTCMVFITRVSYNGSL
jgi:hypothetical protein